MLPAALFAAAFSCFAVVWADTGVLVDQLQADLTVTSDSSPSFTGYFTIKNPLQDAVTAWALSFALTTDDPATPTQFTVLGGATVSSINGQQATGNATQDVKAEFILTPDASTMRIPAQGTVYICFQANSLAGDLNDGICRYRSSVRTGPATSSLSGSGAAVWGGPSSITGSGSAGALPASARLPDRLARRAIFRRMLASTLPVKVYMGPSITSGVGMSGYLPASARTPVLRAR